MPDHKYITLQVASKQTPFDSNYLGLLIRNGRLFGVKKRGRWYTTEDAVRQYMKNSARVEIPKNRMKSFLAHIGLGSFLLLFILLFFSTVSGGGFFEKGKEEAAQALVSKAWSMDGKDTALVSENSEVSSLLAVR